MVPRPRVAHVAHSLLLLLFILPHILDLSHGPQTQGSPCGTQPAATSVHTPSHSAKVSTLSSSIHTHNPPGRADHWKIIAFSINIIIRKAAILHQMLSYIKPNAVLITETKLNKDIKIAGIMPNDQGVCRKDRRNVVVWSCWLRPAT